MKQVYVIVCMLLCALGSAMGMQNREYYVTHNLKNLKKNGEPHHAPCSIIINGHFEETPEKTTIQALTRHLDEALKANIIILVSKSILYNLIMRKQHAHDKNHPENKSLISSRELLIDDAWKVYSVNGSQFFLLVPQWYLDLYTNDEQAGLLLSRLTPLKGVLPQNSRKPDFTHLIDLTKDHDLQNQPLFDAPSPDSFVLPALEHVFARSKFVIWDCIVDGHGFQRGLIAGVSPEVMRTVLLFFNTKITTGVVNIQTCSAGEKI